MSTQLFQTQMEDLVIPNGTAVSNAINWARDYFDSESFTIFGPATLAETTTIQISMDGTIFDDLMDSTIAAIKGPQAASQAIVYNGVFAPNIFLRLKASGNVAADRTFKTIKAWRA